MFSINCYFRQNWDDSRLSFTPIGNITELRPSIRMLDNIWKPDTFFLNGKSSYLHTITSSNKLFRIQPDGHILYSQRSVNIFWYICEIYFVDFEGWTTLLSQIGCFHAQCCNGCIKRKCNRSPGYSETFH